MNRLKDNKNVKPPFVSFHLYDDKLVKTYIAMKCAEKSAPFRVKAESKREPVLFKEK